MYDLEYPYAFEQGRQAYKLGHCLTANPYNRHSHLIEDINNHDDWQAGWEREAEF